VGDQLAFSFFGVSELDTVQTVRPDGKVSLQLVGEVGVVGMSPLALRKDLVERYTRHLRRPSQLNVEVRQLADRRVFVAGAVARPGVFPLPGQMSILEAVMSAGGFDRETAEPANVVVIRHRDGRRYGGMFDLRSLLAGKPNGDPVFQLQSRDLVYVPRTTISQVGQWIDQHINQLVPQFGVVYSTPVGSGTLALDTTNVRLRNE
jgi:protein involved in polysaccharide export with SLBB domain